MQQKMQSKDIVSSDSFQTEMEMVTLCIRPRMTEAERLQLKRILRACPDWRRVIEIATIHKVLLFVYQSLKSYAEWEGCGLEDVPAAALSKIHAKVSRKTMRSMLLVGELVKVLKLFEAENIKALPFKGPAVAYSLYGNLGLREFNDLDILVRETDIVKATALLVARGYKAPDQIINTVNKPFLQFTPFLESPQSQGAFDFYRRDGVAVELHWRFSPRHFPFALAEPKLWDRLGRVQFPGYEASNLPPEDMLLLLCVHGSKHCWHRLNWICDVAALLSAAPQLNWKVVQERAKNLRVERMLHIGLLLAVEVTAADVPKDALQAARRDREAVRLATWVQRRHREKPTEALSETEEYRFIFHLWGNALARLKYCRHLLITPAKDDWDFLPLPGSLASLYYLLRPLRLALGFMQRRLFPAKRSS